MLVDTISSFLSTAVVLQCYSSINRQSSINNHKHYLSLSHPHTHKHNGINAVCPSVLTIQYIHVRTCTHYTLLSHLKLHVYCILITLISILTLTLVLPLHNVHVHVVSSQHKSTEFHGKTAHKA